MVSRQGIRIGDFRRCRYNGAHPYMGETDEKGRLEWIAALDKVVSLALSAVIAGHKAPGTDDSPRVVEETRRYIEVTSARGLSVAKYTARAIHLTGGRGWQSPPSL